MPDTPNQDPPRRGVPPEVARRLRLKSMHTSIMAHLVSLQKTETNAPGFWSSESNADEAPVPLVLVDAAVEALAAGVPPRPTIEIKSSKTTIRGKAYRDVLVNGKPDTIPAPWLDPLLLLNSGRKLPRAERHKGTGIRAWLKSRIETDDPTYPTIRRTP